MRHKLAALVLASAIALCVATANAQSEEAPALAPAASDARVVDMQRFCGRRNAQQRYYPTQALERRIEGRAVLDCTLTQEGALQGCQVIEETPQNMRFGDAALRIACHIRVTETTPSDANTQIYEREGVRRVRRAINFRLQ
jgi:TonB family protein